MTRASTTVYSFKSLSYTGNILIRPQTDRKRKLSWADSHREMTLSSLGLWYPTTTAQMGFDVLL